MINKKLQQLQQQNLYRHHKTIEYVDGNCVVINGKKLVNFSSNDYLYLANNKEIKQALIDYLKNYPLGSGASHLITGHFAIHSELSQQLAEYIGCEKVILFSTGYMANLAVFSALQDEINWVLQDKLNHASLIDANRLINLPIRRYKHNDMYSLKNNLKKQIGIGLVASDYVFSMDGDRADAKKINKLREHNYLLLDDAHGFGLFDNEIDNWNNVLYMATFGKAFGTQGACIGGNSELIDFLVQKARPYIYTTAISPAMSMATAKSLEIVRTGKQQQKLFSNIKYFKEYANNLDIDFLESNSAIMPLIIGSSKNALHLSKKLYEQGFLVSAIREPTVAPKTARLRITISANHTQKQIKDLLDNLLLLML